MGVAVALFFGFGSAFFFAYILYWLDRYEKEPLLLLGGVFLWGALVAAGGAFIINTVLGLGIYMFTGSEAAADLTTGSLIAPIVEESLKGLAVLGVFLLFRKEFDSVLDGIVYAGVAALGFAATENAYYIYSYGFADNGWEGLFQLVFIRIVLVGWQHPFYTAFTGIGLAASRLNRSLAVKLITPVLGWLAAVTAHALHNTIASLAGGVGGLVFGTALDWLGWTFMLIFIVVAIYRERSLMRAFLRDEVTLGTLTADQLRVASSAWSQSGARLAAVFSGAYRRTNHFYQLCAELSHKKNQLARLGEESGNAIQVERIRAELRALSPGV